MRTPNKYINILKREGFTNVVNQKEAAAFFEGSVGSGNTEKDENDAEDDCDGGDGSFCFLDLGNENFTISNWHSTYNTKDTKDKGYDGSETNAIANNTFRTHLNCISLINLLRLSYSKMFN